MNRGATYSFFDSDVKPGEQITYWLQEVEINGRTNDYPATQAKVVYFIELPLIAR